MRLENLLKKFPSITLATHENNDEILDFFGQHSLKNKAESVHYHRHPDFFALIRARGSEGLTFLLRDEEDRQNRLQGVAVINLRPGFINGKLTTVGYLGDLRVSLNRKLIRQWRSCFKEVIENSYQLEETQGCRYFQTALMDDNGDSRASLASNKIAGVHYEKLKSYQMVNIIGSYPHLKDLKSTPLIAAQDSDYQDLLTFLETHNRFTEFAHFWEKELTHRLQTWTGFSLNNFLLQKNDKGKITGCVHYYNPKSLKTMSLSAIPKEIKALKTLTNLFPVIKQFPVPKPNETMDVVYVSNPIIKEESKRDELMRSALKYIQQHQKDIHMIAVTSWEDENYSEALKGFICHKTPMALFSVHPLDQKKPLFMNLYPLKNPPQFDMALV